MPTFDVEVSALLTIENVETEAEAIAQAQRYVNSRRSAVSYTYEATEYIPDEDGEE